MKVLTVTNMYPTASKPSYGVFVKRQVEAIGELGHEYNVVFMDGSRRKTNYLTGIREIRNAVQRFEPDLIHAHYGLTGFVARYAKSVPLVISLCGDDVLGTPDWNGRPTVKSRIIRHVTRIGCRAADEIIVKSREMANVVGKWGFKEAHVIPNGVNTTFFAPVDRLVARRRLGLSEKKKYVLFPQSAYVPGKRIDLARKVVHRLQQSGCDVELLVVYGQPQEVLREYYSAADIMFLTSESEGSPNVLKEAMACSLATVSFDVGDVAWLCGGTKHHYVVPKHDVQFMHKISLALLSASEDIRGDGRTKIVNELSGQDIGRRVEEVYHHALERNSA